MHDVTHSPLWRTDQIFSGPDGLRGYGKYQKLAQPTVELVFQHTKGYGAVLQAGGHIGLMALALATRFVQVYTVELARDNFLCLTANVAADPHIHALYGALGDGEPVAIVRAKYSACHYAHGPGTVPCYRIDDLWLPTLDALVLDLEGGEVVALQHARETLERHRPLVVVEEYPRWMKRYNRRPGDVARLLSGWGYRQIGEGGMDLAFAYGE